MIQRRPVRPGLNDSDKANRRVVVSLRRTIHGTGRAADCIGILAMTPEELRKIDVWRQPFTAERGLREAADTIERLQGDMMKRIAELEQKNADIEWAHTTALQMSSEEWSAVQRDAKRYRWIQENASRSHSPHMDNTWCFELRRMLNGRHSTCEAAIDAAMEDA